MKEKCWKIVDAVAILGKLLQTRKENQQVNITEEEN